jgi:cytochrome oxidase Cu insertion factor (SCO1/SenC/PrrC family)
MLRAKTLSQFTFAAILLTSQLLSACSARTSPASPAGAGAVTAPGATPDWYNIAMTDVQTGKTFTISDFAGKVVLIGTIAEWCPNCIFQQAETRKMFQQLGNPEDLILISLDVDSHEDEASLKQYAEDFDFEWRFAVAPLLVQRAMGNLYNAEYLNPPLNPMLLIDRQGIAHQLPYKEKKVDALQKIVEPYLAK